MKKVFLMLFIVSAFGAITTVCSVAISSIVDGDVQHGTIIEIHRNDNFFYSESKLLNSVLVIPRYFLKVNDFKRNDGEFSVEGYGTLNIIIGFFSIVILVLTTLTYEEDLKGKIFSFVYTFYWSIVTIFMYIQFFSGVFLFSTSSFFG